MEILTETENELAELAFRLACRLAYYRQSDVSIIPLRDPRKISHEKHMLDVRTWLEHFEADMNIFDMFLMVQQ